MTGIGSLIRLALRRDWVLLPIWALLFAALAYSSAAATQDLYADPAALASAAGAVNDSPALRAMYGTIHDVTSVGAVSLFKMGSLGGVGVAILAIMLMIRHTRAEEEAGRLELLGATVVGRLAPLAAAFLVVVGEVLVLGLLTALFLIGTGLPAAGSLAFGLGCWGGIGLVFASVAGVTAQLTHGARAANGAALAALGVAFLLRAVGDSSSWSGLSWASPIGWGLAVRAYQGERWWVLALPLVLAAALSTLAVVLVGRRDHGAGLLPDRLGPAAGRLRTPLGLAWRLHRGVLGGWLAAFVVLGLLFGTIATNLSGFLDSDGASTMIQRLGGVSSLTDAFLSTELSFLGIFAAAYSVQAVARLRAEESSGRAEPVLATGVSRRRWVWSHLVVALLGTAALLVAAGLAAGLAYSAQTGHPTDLGRVLVAAVVRLPAAWVLAGLTVGAFGLVPRLTIIGWIGLVLFLLLGELGPLLRLPQAVMDLSPFAHSPHLPGGPLSATPLVALVAVAALLVAAGLVGLRRRDLPVP